MPAPDRLEHALPLVAEHQCPVIVLALDDKGIPKTVDDRVDIIGRLINATRQAGIADHKLYIDPLIMAISTGDDAGFIACETMRRVRKQYPEAHLTGGQSNISFGAPANSVNPKASDQFPAPHPCCIQAPADGRI